MEKVIKSNEFVLFKNDLNNVLRKMNEVKDEVNVDVKIKYNLEKYYQIIEGSDEVVLHQYETWYNQLLTILIINDNAIEECKKIISQFNDLIELVKEEEKNNDEIKRTLNSVVDKMLDKEKVFSQIK